MSILKKKGRRRGAQYRERGELRFGDGKRDRYLAEWWDNTKVDGRMPSTIIKMIVYEALTRQSSITGKPIAVELLEGRDRSIDDEEVKGFIGNFGV